MMANTTRRGRTTARLGLALACLAASPAQAQFMTGAYPVIVVPPPPAQSMVMPKKPKPAAPETAPVPPPAESDPGLGQNYQGRTRIR